MTAALLYKPANRGRAWLSFAAAIAIHGTAIALAGIHPPTMATLGATNPDEPTVVIVDMPPPIEPQPPSLPDELPAPELPLDRPDFVESGSTPQKMKPHTAPPPLARAPTAATVSINAARALTTLAPRPAYPYEARRRKITGEGVALLTVDRPSGRVIDVTMASSTGSDLLDQSAIAALRRWRFRAGTVSRVKCPLTFTLAGVQY